MSDVAFDDAAQALDGAYAAITAAVTAATVEQFALPSFCAGWTVADVLFHQLLDAQRALVGFATPTQRPATTDFVSYWRPFKPGMAGADEHAQFVRRAAAAFSSPLEIAQWWAETSSAARRAAASSDAASRIETQGHSIAVSDFIVTLAVEAAIHHLDLTRELAGTAPPPAAALALARRTLDGLLGAPVPVRWDDTEYILKGTGRVALDGRDARLLGRLATRFPLLG